MEKSLPMANCIRKKRLDSFSLSLSGGALLLLTSACSTARISFCVLPYAWPFRKASSSWSPGTSSLHDSNSCCLGKTLQPKSTRRKSSTRINS